MPGNDPEQLSYRDAVTELEAILEAIEHDDVDVDLLSAKVHRATALLKVCRDRLGAARVDLEQLTSQVDPAGRVEMDDVDLDDDPDQETGPDDDA